MSSLSIGAGSSSTIKFSGLASGLDTAAIIEALMGAERQPVIRLTTQQEKLQAQQGVLQSIQSSLRQLTFAVADFSLPAVFESTQTVTSSEPTRVSAASTVGAGVGGHQIEVTQLANSSQRTFAFTSPAAGDTVTIDGHEYTINAGASAKELASKINSDSTATVYAAVVESGTIVFSSRATGNTGAEFIAVSDTAGALTENALAAKEGKNAEYTVDGVAGTSASNTITSAIPGVTLTLEGLTTMGPVTINVHPPAPSVTAIEAKVQAFVTLYNTTVAAIQKQLSTKPPAHAANASEFATGALFGDHDLTSLISRMRQTMYEPIKELPVEMASPADIGLSTGAATGGGGSSQSALEGQLNLNPAKLKEAIETNPAGTKLMLQKWSQGLRGMINVVAEPAGTLGGRIEGDSRQITYLTHRISIMNEMLAVRERALQATYSKLEGVISQNSARASWLTSQERALNKNSL
ncbi:MAG TPA: flagellar filament capping protein FliD [Solirubrobacteraceae bacterium]|nr:flagellar filament capping protein FliD [Solirubrobacteraceae bacterium]